MPYIYSRETGEHQDVSPDYGRTLIEAGTHCWNPQALEPGPARDAAMKHEGDMVREHNERVQMERLNQARAHRAYVNSLSPAERSRYLEFERMTAGAAREARGGGRNVS